MRNCSFEREDSEITVLSVSQKSHCSECEDLHLQIPLLEETLRHGCQSAEKRISEAEHAALGKQTWDSPI